MNGTAAQGTAQNAAQGFGQGTPPSGFAGRGGGMMFAGPYTTWILIGLLVAMLVVLAIAFYKIANKAGLASWIGLLMLVPVVNLGVALYVAFTSWPALAEVSRLKAIAASVSQWGRPADGSADSASATPSVSEEAPASV